MLISVLLSYPLVTKTQLEGPTAPIKGIVVHHLEPFELFLHNDESGPPNIQKKTNIGYSNDSNIYSKVLLSNFGPLCTGRIKFLIKP